MNSIEAIQQTIKAGIGVAIIPKIVIRTDTEKEEVARVHWADDLETGVLIIRYKDKWYSPAVEGFMDTMRRFVSMK
jgi:DNA-binding transcriptional LysR family regulator